MKTERWGRGKGLWGKEEDDIRDLGERERDGGPVTKLRIKNTKKDGRGGKRWWRKVGGGRVDLRQRVAREQWLVISSPWNKPSRPCVAPFNRARRLLHAPKTEGVSRGHRFSTA